VSRFNIPINTL